MENKIAEMEKLLKARKDKSAWNKGVTLYAADLLDSYADRVTHEGREAEDWKEFRLWLLNGADDWKHFSYSGNALAYDADIAERLCTPSELKRTKGGLNRPNGREEWLDVQTRALKQAAKRLTGIYLKTIEEV